MRQLWQTEGVQTDFVHPLRLVDGIYPAVAVTPYGTLLDALRDSRLLQVKVTRYETVTKELPFETQTVEDADLDFGKTETVQAGQSGSEQVTSEIVTVDGAVVSCQAVDVQLLQAPVPEIIHRGTRLKSGMIGKLGTGSFLWPVPGYSGISRWANLPYGHRGVDITAPTRARSSLPSGTITLPRAGAIMWRLTTATATRRCTATCRPLWCRPGRP